MLKFIATIFYYSGIKFNLLTNNKKVWYLTVFGWKNNFEGEKIEKNKLFFKCYNLYSFYYSGIQFNLITNNKKVLHLSGVMVEKQLTQTQLI